MPFETESWTSSSRVRGMNLMQRGAYLELLIAQWDRDDDRLPDDEEELKRIAGWPSKHAPNDAPNDASFSRVTACFRRRNGWIWNQKCRDLKRRARIAAMPDPEKTQKRRDAAAIRWEREKAMQMHLRMPAEGDANAYASASEIDANASVLHRPLTAAADSLGVVGAAAAGEGTRGGGLVVSQDAPLWLLELSAAHQRRLIAAAEAKRRDLVELALECDEYWIAKDAQRPPMNGPRWYSRMTNWIGHARPAASVAPAMRSSAPWHAPKPRHGGSNVDPATEALLDEERHGGGA